MSEEQETTIISRLSIENALGIKMVSITPDGKPIMLTGKNKAGKTSILKAIEAFRGKRFREEDFIRHGSDKAVIKLDTPRWEAKLTVTQKTERLEVRAPDGKSYASPQTILDAWFGDITFNPLAFANLPLPEKVKIIKELTGLDTSAIDAVITEKYQARTEVNRKLKAAQAVLAQMPEHEADLPDEPIPIKVITDELAVCRELEEFSLNRQRDRLNRNTQVKISDDNIAQWKEQIKDLEAKIADTEIARDIYIAWLNVNPELPDTFTERKWNAEQRLADLDETNKKIREENARKEQFFLVESLDLKSSELTDALEELDTRKRQVLEAVQYPIEGLKLVDNQLYFNDIPFPQLSTGEGMRISCAIAASLNPALRTILIRDGSLLDKAGREEVLQFAEERQFQCWLEMMDEPETIEGKTYYPAGFYIENGVIAAIDGVPVEEKTNEEA